MDDQQNANMKKNKKKPEIVQDIRKIQATNRMRQIIRHDVYPLLLELNGTIGYSKIFLQTCATAIESLFEEKRRTVKVSEFIPRLNELFSTNYDDKDKYRRLFEILKDESVVDFNTMIQTMPRVIESYFTQEIDKKKIMELDIDKILG